MERPTCKTCPFWAWQNELNEDQADDEFVPFPGVTNDDIEDAKCRRNAPVATKIEQHGTPIFTDHYNFSLVWPETSSHEWCGEHPDFPAYIASLKEEKDARDPRKTVKQRFEPPMGHRP